MSLRSFRRAGHTPTLIASFLYFDVSFMVWVMLGPLAPFLAESLKLTATQKGILTAIPLLGGSFFRPILGWMTERIGGRRTGLIGLGSILPARSFEMVTGFFVEISKGAARHTVWFAMFGSLWAALNGTWAMMSGLNAAYEVAEQRIVVRSG